jgi:putative MATE family efflux protein
MVITEGFFMLGTTTDMIWVGKLGAASIAGMGIAFTIFILVVSAKMGLVMGARAIVARFIGAGDVAGANHAARQAFVISAGYAIVTTAIGVLFAEPILSLLGLEADVVAEGTAYMRIMFAGWVVMCFWLMAYSIMQASGDTVTPMRITITFKLFNMALCPFMVLGWWVFPRMGISGAATSFVIAQSLGLALALWALFSGRSRLRLTLRNFRLDPDMIWRIVRIGIPAAVMGAQRTVANLVLMWFLVPFGTLAVAAHSLGQRIEMVMVLPILGLGAGAGVLVGQNLGARQPERAERSGWLATGFAEGFLGVCSLAILLWAEGITSIFNSEPSLVAIASTFLRIAAAGYLVLGFTIVLQNCVSGAGDTLPAMVFGLAIVWLVQLPLAFLLPQVTNLGVYGVRWAITAGVVVGSAAFVTYFRMGRWKRKKV